MTNLQSVRIILSSRPRLGVFDSCRKNGYLKAQQGRNPGGCPDHVPALRQTVSRDGRDLLESAVFVRKRIAPEARNMAY